MKGIFDVKLQINSWESQHWDIKHFVNAFMDQYKAMFYGLFSQFYNFANKGNMEKVDSNILTINKLKNNFESDFLYVNTKFVDQKVDFDYNKFYDDMIKEAREFRLDFKDREDKTLTHDEQVRRMYMNIEFVIASAQYDIDCINESKDKEAYESLCKRVYDKRGLLIQESRELCIYDELKEKFDSIKDVLKIDTSSFVVFDKLEEIEFKA